MNNISAAFLKRRYYFWILLILFFSCKDYKEAPPLPVFETEFKQPEKKGLEFSKMDTLNWETKKRPAGTIRKSTRFDWSKIPAKPFEIDNIKPLVDEKPSVALNWDSLPTTAFHFDSLPKQKLAVKVKALGKPKVVKAGYPVNAEEASRGIMTFDDNFGLPGEAFTTIMDRDGLIWFGTGSGLCSYDSENIKIYDTDQGLVTGGILSIFQDKTGRMWVGDHLGNLSVIDLKSNLIYELKSSFNKQQVLEFMEASDGKVWFSQGRAGYQVIDFEEKNIWHMGEDILPDDFSITPFQDLNGRIWLTSDKGVIILNLENNTKKLLRNKEGLLSDFTVSVFQSPEGVIFICSGLGVSMINKDKTKISYITENLEFDGRFAAMSILEEDNGDLWIGTDKGTIVRYSAGSKTVEKIQAGGEENTTFFKLFKDKMGQLWAPTFNNHIYLYNPSYGRIGNYSENDGLLNASIWGTVKTKDGRIWFGNEEGIDVYDPNRNELKQITQKNGLISIRSNNLYLDSKGRIWSYGLGVAGVNRIDEQNKRIEVVFNHEEFNGNYIVSALESHDGRIWLGDNGGILHVLDERLETLSSIVIDTIGEYNLIDNIIEDNQGDIWVGGRGMGIHKINPIDHTRKSYSEQNGLISNDVYGLFKDSNSDIWVTTQKGVHLMNIRQDSITTFSMDQGLGSKDVYAVIEKNKNIYLGTSNGISILNKVRYTGKENVWKVKTLNKRDGLNYVDVHTGSFIIDDEQRLWAAMDQEVLVVIDEIKEDTIAPIVNLTGINIFDQKAEFYDPSALERIKSEIDTLWLQDSKEYLLPSDPEFNIAVNVSETIEWSGVQGPYKLPENLVLPYDQNYLSFSFNGAQFSKPNKVVYRYILEGIDKSWSQPNQNITSETYRDLVPGDYTFKVSSKGFNGIWSNPQSFSFSILPPWWHTWWAYTIFVILFLGLGLAILQYRSRWLKKENRILEERVSHRTAQLKKTIDELESTQSQLIHSEKMASLGELTAGIAHEIQNPMNFINNFSEVSQELIGEMCEEIDKGDLEEAKEISQDLVQNLEKISHHGKRASSIVRGMLEHSRNSSGHKEFVDINVLADEYLRLAYHGLRAKDKSFNADFKTDFDESLQKVEIIPQDLGRVVLNIINNAFFAVTSIPEDKRDENYKPLVTVSTKDMGDQVLISIKDNGPGIPEEIKDKIFQPFFTTKPTGKGTGLGLSLAYDIVTTGHGGALELNTAPGEGTEFAIYIPK